MLIDKLKEIILHNATAIGCPSECELSEIKICDSAKDCRDCWQAAIRRAEAEGEGEKA